MNSVPNGETKTRDVPPRHVFVVWKQEVPIALLLRPRLVAIPHVLQTCPTDVLHRHSRMHAVRPPVSATMFYVRSMFVLCSFYVRSMFVLCSFYVRSMFVLCSFYVRSMFVLCSFCALCSFYVRSMFVLCSMPSCCRGTRGTYKLIVLFTVLLVLLVLLFNMQGPWWRRSTWN
jgi:hypothetical protein